MIDFPLYQQTFGVSPDSIEPLPQSGSNRRYYRLHGQPCTYIAVRGESQAENRAFVILARHFRAQGLPVPEIYACTDDFACYLQEDLGTVALFDALQHGRETGTYSADEKTLLHKTMALLPAVQFRGAEQLDFTVCYPQPAFDARMVAFDLNYFKYCFLKTLEVDFDELRLQDDFDAMTRYLLQYQSDTFLYRDFQARNVMLKNGEPYLIDFQGGRRGPIYYDVASFLWQAKAAYPTDLRNELIDTYLQALQPYRTISKDDFMAVLRHFVLFRTLQVLGAYGFRGNFERKPHFRQSIPFAIDNLRDLLQQPFAEYPYLTELLHRLTQLPTLQKPNLAASNGRLLVRIFSFSYKKGIPDDVSGNGGGYVFDCRATHNPGRYEPYKKLTGRDAPVIKFLEDDGEILPFLQHVYALADAHVARYIERGFTDLMFAFGCTGGQHRSVYCAEHLAEHLHQQFDVDIRLEHREQHLVRTL